jgi:hypothetical protein
VGHDWRPACCSYVCSQPLRRVLHSLHCARLLLLEGPAAASWHVVHQQLPACGSCLEGGNAMRLHAASVQ